MDNLQLGNAANWESLGSYTAQGAPVPNNPNAYQPIPEFNIPLLIDSPIIALLVESATKKPSWHFAGYVFQKIRLGITVGGVPDSSVLESRVTWFDRISFVMFRRLTPEYSIALKPPFWIKDIKVTVWKYTGIISTEELDKITDVQSTVDLIKLRVDSL